MCGNCPGFDLYERKFFIGIVQRDVVQIRERTVTVQLFNLICVSTQYILKTNTCSDIPLPSVNGQR